MSAIFSQGARSSAELLRRTLDCLLKRDEEQDIRDGIDTSTHDVESHEDEADPILEMRLVSLRWLTMTLNIMKFKKYVEACRKMKREPNPSKLNAACTNILTLRRYLISYYPNSDDYEPGVITEKRALKNLKYVIADNTWVADLYILEDLYSTICHIDSLENYKMTEDPRNLFASNKALKHHINTFLN